MLGDGPVIVFHDGFRLTRWRGWFVREGMRGVIIDTHAYLVMSERPEVLFRILPDAWLMRWYRLFAAWGARRIRRAARFTPVMVGEWCVANGLAARMGSAGRKVRSRPLMRLVVRSTDMVRSVTAVRMLETAHPVTSVRARATPGDGVPSPAARRRAVYLRVAAMQLDAWNVSAGQVYWSFHCAAVAASLTVCASRAPVWVTGTPP